MARKRNGRSDMDIPNRRPSSGQRLEVIAFGMEWDKAARESGAGRPYRGSGDELEHRLGRNLPTSRNGSNT